MRSIQFNEAGAFSGSKDVVWERISSLFGVSGSISGPKIAATGVIKRLQAEKRSVKVQIKMITQSE